MVTTIASINDIADGGEKFVVGYNDGTSGLIPSAISGVRAGNIVRTASVDGERQIVEIVKQWGWTYLRTIGVVENILSDTLVVRTENGLQSIPWSGQSSVEPGNTVELSQANTFCRVIDVDPIDITPQPDVNIESITLDVESLIGGDSETGPDEEDVVYAPERDIETSFDDIGGLHNVKQRVEEAVFVPRERAYEFEQLNLDMKRGLLFFGPPGTGKTMMARALAHRLEGFFFSIGGPEIVSKYYGESERQIRDRFDAAKAKASEEDTSAIVFIDEIDSIVPRRAGADETERRIVAQFLDVLDGLGDRGDVIVIGATNRVDAIDPAVRRPGRLDEEIKFELPNTKERMEILEVILRNKPVSRNIDLIELANLTQGWSGADLDYLIERSGLLAAGDKRTEIVEEDVMIAFEKIDNQRKSRKKRAQEETEQ